MKEYDHEFADHWFYTTTPVEKSSGLQIIRSGRNKAKSHYHIGPRFIPYFSIHCVLKGTGTYIDEDKEYSIKSGDAFCLYSNHIHSYFTDPNDPLEMFWIAFDGQQAASILNQIEVDRENTYIHNILSLNTRTTIENLIDLFQHYHSYKYFKKLSYFYQLIDDFYEAKNKNKGACPHDWIQESMNYMNLHYAEGITITDVARHVGASRTHFSNTFTKAVGSSPYKYLQEKIMTKATTLLESSRYNISEIALSLSFSDVYSFSRAFKNYYNVSPSEYKRLHSIP
ncbi:AraC family transcriptional regulator [Salibacterium aidingense]|uniref:AraC family transcriptional regulator n=1 Tax=Salibacterium aidingense TaxID=384933 RepID=UPI003BDD8628